LEDPDARIDLGGIAKGYITDRLMELYATRGVTDAFVNLGGNVAVMGRNSEGRAWNVGVRDPDDASGTQVVATISTEGGSLVTSGLYERSFEKDGKRYWHILDPRTGYPVQTDVVSASVYARASIDGDGYTKPLFMMERDDALAFVESHEGIEALLIAADGNIFTTRNAHFVKRS
jgi:thiamine biosynthesis lipoprotein